MRIAMVAVAGLFASLSPVWAVDRFSCKAEDPEVKISVTSQTRNSGRLFQFGGTLAIDRPGVAEDLRNLSLGDDHMAQNWADGEELKLHIYHRRGGAPDGLVTLLIQTRAQQAGGNDYRGSYFLTLYDEPAPGREAQIFSLRGTITCTTG
jgi:hypothetical protein